MSGEHGCPDGDVACSDIVDAVDVQLLQRTRNALKDAVDDALALESNSSRAAMLSDIVCWGGHGGTGEYGRTGYPTTGNFQMIVPSSEGFAALRDDGTVFSWGKDIVQGGSIPPAGAYVDIVGGEYWWSALKADSGVVAWGRFPPYSDGFREPTDTGYVRIFSSLNRGTTMFGRKADGTLTCWRQQSHTTCENTPTEAGFSKVAVTAHLAAGLKEDGSIRTWAIRPQTYTYTPSLPAHADYTEIVASTDSFAALRVDGSISCWTRTGMQAQIQGCPTDSGYTKVFAAAQGFAAIKPDGSLQGWGNPGSAPAGSGFVDVVPGNSGFVAMRPDGSMEAWGDITDGVPTDGGYTQVICSVSGRICAALKGGYITQWGAGTGYWSHGNDAPPTTGGHTCLYMSRFAFCAATGPACKFGGGGGGGGGSTATAVGDPHIQSSSGFRFELRRAGSHVLLDLPRGAREAEALVRVRALVDSVGSECGPMFIKELLITGRWLGNLTSLRMLAEGGARRDALFQLDGSEQLTAEEFAERAPSKLAQVRTPQAPPAPPVRPNTHSTTMVAALKLGPGVTQKVSWVLEMVPSGRLVRSLWLTASNLRAAGVAVGGLLGVETYPDAARPPEQCSKQGAGLFGPPNARVTAQAWMDAESPPPPRSEAK